jgi:SAM-dependent methyltransferase
MNRQNTLSEDKTNGLTVAANHFYWKPSQAFFHSFELEEYRKANLTLTHRILDIGCRDGVFSLMLKDLQILDFTDAFLDIDMDGLRKIIKNGLKNAIQCDARVLAIKSASFDSVIANELLSSIPTDLESDIDQTIKEIYRVLVNNGLFVFSVPTKFFGKNLLITKMFNEIGAHKLADKYDKYMNHRAAHYLVFNEEFWKERLLKNNFSVLKVGYSLTPDEGNWYSFLTIPVFRVFGVLKILNFPWLTRTLSVLLIGIFRNKFQTEQKKEQAEKKNSAGFLLIVARKD